MFGAPVCHGFYYDYRKTPPPRGVTQAVHNFQPMDMKGSKVKELIWSKNLLKKTKAHTGSWFILRTEGKQWDFRNFSHNLTQTDGIVGFPRNLELLSTRNVQLLCPSSSGTVPWFSNSSAVLCWLCLCHCFEFFLTSMLNNTSEVSIVVTVRSKERLTGLTHFTTLMQLYCTEATANLESLLGIR